MRVLPVCLLLLSLLWPAGARSARDWDPSHTWVFVVGILEWKDKDMWDSFPKEKRRDRKLADAFRAQGVPETHILRLEDSYATCERIHSAFDSFLEKTGPQDFLVVYYAGHGYTNDDNQFFMAPYDSQDDATSWSATSLLDSVEHHFHGARALLAADCCYSGSLSKAIQKGSHRVSYASLTSSTAKYSSTGNWTFTDSLLDALRGDPVVDANHDGTITFAEVGRFIQGEMRFVEDQDSTYATSGDFSADTALEPVSRSLKAGEGQRVEVLYDGAWWKARVLEKGPQGVKVHWLGEGADYPDEWVEPSSLKS